MTTIDNVIRRLIEASGAKTQAEMLRILGFSGATASTWKKRGEMPEGSLKRASIACNVNLEWLSTGEGEMRPGEATDKAADLKILRAVIEAVEEQLQGEGKNLGPAKKAELIATLYEMFAEEDNKQVDKKTVARLIRLAT